MGAGHQRMRQPEPFEHRNVRDSRCSVAQRSGHDIAKFGHDIAKFGVSRR